MVDADEQARKEGLKKIEVAGTGRHYYARQDENYGLQYYNEKHKKHGLNLPYDKYEHSRKEPWNLSVDCETRPLLREAEKVFIDASLDILPKDLKKELSVIKDISNYMRQQKFIEINMMLDVGDML